MELSQIKDIVALLTERSAAWQSLWTVFYTVSAAVVTLIASGKIQTPCRWPASTLASVGLVLFAAGNYRALNQVRLQREALVAMTELRASAAKSEDLVHFAQAWLPPTLSELRLYHGGCVFSSWPFSGPCLWCKRYPRSRTSTATERRTGRSRLVLAESL